MPYREAKVLIAKAPPDGLGLKLSISTLQRFYARKRSTELDDERVQTLADARKLVDHTQEPELIEHAALDLIRQRFFSSALSTSCSAQELKNLYSILLKLKED